MKQTLLLLLVSAVVLVACTSAPVTTLDGQWASVEFDATLFIDGTSMGGQGPCNSYGGQVQYTEDSIHFLEIFQTLMYCEHSSDQEAAYISALQSATSYILSGDTLTITGPDTTLVFTR